jgi:transcriptional regulator NrdR family protein
MNCPICQSPKSSVSNTYAGDRQNKRRRQCERCGHRWNTFESTEDVARKLDEIQTALAPVLEKVKQ